MARAKIAINNWKLILMGLLTLLVYGLLIGGSPARLVYDEGYYIPIARESMRYASAFDPGFILQLKAPTGILYSGAHGLFSPLTKVAVPSARFINLIFLAITWYLLDRWIRLGERSFANSALGALPSGLMLLAFPTTGFITCLALTESSSIMLAVAGLALLNIAYFIAKAADNINLSSSLSSSMLFAGAGVLIGLSTLGRQNFCVLGLAALPFFVPFKRRELIQLAAFLCPLVLIFTYPVIVWQGLVPPAVKFVESGWRLNSFIMSLGYASGFAAICWPNIFNWSIATRPFMFFLSASITPLSLDLIRLGPLRPVIERIVGEIGVASIQLIVALIISYLGLILILSLASSLKSAISETHWRPDLAMCSLAIFLIALSNIKISHQFSLRYITLMVPFMAYLGSFASAYIHRWRLRYLISFTLSCLPVAAYFFVMT